MKKIIRGTSECPRLYVFRSNKHIYAQMIDDTNHKILVSSSSLDNKLKSKMDNTNNCIASKIIGKDIAQKAKRKGINKVIFDRGSKLYHGRIKTLADSAREEGIYF